MVSPLLVPVWIAGLRAPFRRPEWRLRFVPVTFAAMAVLYFAGNGHAYYLASLYPVLLGLGARPTAEWTVRAPRRTPLLATAVALSAVVSGLIALPLLPEHDLQGSVVMALDPAQGETVGWPAFVQTLSRAWRQAPAGERRHTRGGRRGRPPWTGTLTPARVQRPQRVSEWGEPPAADAHALRVGFNDAAPYFEQCRTLATVNDHVGLNNNEQGLPMMLCRATGAWATLWPHLTHYD